MWKQSIIQSLIEAFQEHDVDCNKSTSNIKIKSYNAIKRIRSKWTNEDRLKFIEGVRLYKYNWMKIAEHVGTKNVYHIRLYPRALNHYFNNNPESEGVDILPLLAKQERRIFEIGSKVPYYTQWSAKEHDRLLEGLQIYGKDFKQLTEHVGTKDFKSTRNKVFSIK